MPNNQDKSSDEKAIEDKLEEFVPVQDEDVVKEELQERAKKHTRDQQEK